MPTRPCPLSNESCRYFPECYEDIHHPDWPKSLYRSRLERRYRAERAVGNYLCRNEHDLLHLLEEPPDKPSGPEMKEYLGE